MSETSSDSNLQTLISQATEQLGQIKALFDNTKTDMAAAKGSVEEIQRTTTADADTITRTKQDIEKLKTDAGAISVSVQNDLRGIQKSIEDLEQKRSALESVLSKIETIRTTADENSAAVSSAVKAITDARATFETLKTQTQAAHDELETKRSAVDSQIAEITKANEGVKEVYNWLLTDTAEKKSIKTAINELHKSVIAVFDGVRKHREDSDRELKELRDSVTAEKNTLIEKTKGEFTELHKILNDQILSLLPSAGAAGLASTYYDAKSKYGVTQFHSNSVDPLNRGTIFQRTLAHDPASFVATIFFYLMFLGPITVIIWLFYDLLEKITTLPAGSMSDRYLIVRTLIAVPLGTVSLFGYTSLRLYRRLYEEYNYKQRVMELYTSFSKEIEGKGDEEQQKTLIAIMLKAVADKPSLGMHRYDGVGKSTGVKFDINELISQLFNKRKNAETT